MTVWNLTSNFKASVDLLIESNPTRAEINRRVAMLENRIAQVDRFYPWPALSESLEEDIKRLRRAPDRSVARR